jgi:hypothetical protein
MIITAKPIPMLAMAILWMVLENELCPFALILFDMKNDRSKNIFNFG